MAQLLIRNLEEETVARLKERAQRDGRSLQAEVKMLLEREANVPAVDREETLRKIMKIRKLFKGRKFPDTVELIREDRDR